MLKAVNMGQSASEVQLCLKNTNDLDIQSFEQIKVHIIISTNATWKVSSK